MKCSDFIFEKFKKEITFGNSGLKVKVLSDIYLILWVTHLSIYLLIY